MILREQRNVGVAVFFCIFLSTSLLSSVALAQGRFGPRGGSGGNIFEDLIPPRSTITEVQVFAGAYVDAIQIYFRSGGQTASLPKRGGNGGQLYRFVLGEGEFITGISGRNGAFVDSILIRTNRRDSPRYGGSGGTYSYQLDAPPGHVVVGFFGRSGTFVDAIGILTQPR